MELSPGSRVGPYEIVDRIGAGGMGEVWRGRDTRIGRDVAVKVLPESFARDEERLRRFEQETRAAGTLNHPGLITIFDVGTERGSPYMVMELLDGQTLRDAIGDGTPLPLRKVVDYATQIAAAIAVAHEKGIIHRDLKPENLFITSDGRVKVLDFGLAKLVAPERSDDVSRTQQRQTSPGTVMGTAGYMSPEQVRGEEVDHRSDIFSLGAILYEMLSGRQAFRRDSSVETMNAILKEDPSDPSTLDPKVPLAVDHIVRHCLEKNPRQRFQSALDLAFQLRTLQDLSGSGVGKVAPLSISRRMPYAIAILALAAALAVAGAIALLRNRNTAAVEPGRSLQQLTFGEGVETFPALAPDGKTFAYVSGESGNRDIYLQRVDGRSSIDLTKDSSDDDYEPAFSPDGSQIAFRSERSGGGIFVMGVTGESVRRLTDFGHNPAWSPDGTRLVVATEGIELQPRARSLNSELWIVDARTGERRPILQQRAEDIRAGLTDGVQPSWSPHGNRIAFWGVLHNSASGKRDVWTIAADSKEPMKTLVRVTTDKDLDWNPVWSPDGKQLYFGSDRDGTLNLWRIRIDEESGRTSGGAVPVALPAPFSGAFSVSQHGEIAFATLQRTDRILAFPFDATNASTGEPRSSLGGSIALGFFDVSPDGQSIAFTNIGRQDDLFVAAVDGSNVRQLTNDAAIDRIPGWSSDGKTIFFTSNRSGAYRLWSIHADGSGLAPLMNDTDAAKAGGGELWYPRASPDDRTLVATGPGGAVFVHLDRPLGQRIEMVGSADGNRETGAAAWSPDGKRLLESTRGKNGPAFGFAIRTLQSGRVEKVLDRGGLPQWLPDGKHLAFLDRKTINVLDLDTRHVISAALPHVPGIDRMWRLSPPRVSTDGKTLFVASTQEQGDIWLLRPEKR